MRLIRVLSIGAFALAATGLLTGPAWAATQSSRSQQTSSRSEMKESGKGQMNKSVQEQREGVTIGQNAPEFTLQDAQGRSHSLAEFKGKDVVLIWSNPNCPVVQRQQREGTLQNLTRKYSGGQVQFIEIISYEGKSPSATSQKQASESQAGREGMLTLYDPQGTVASAWHAQRTPEAFIIDRHGVLTYRGAVESQGQAAEHRNYVDEALSALQQGQTPKERDTQPYGCMIHPQGGQMGNMGAEHGKPGSAASQHQTAPSGLAGTGAETK